MAQQQRVRWHLLNMGSTEDIHSIHFHGQLFSMRTSQEYRMGVYNLYPGKMKRKHSVYPSCQGFTSVLIRKCQSHRRTARREMDLEDSGFVFVQCLALWHPITASNSPVFCSPFPTRCLRDSRDVALTCRDLAGRVQSGRAPASWDECSLPRVQPE